jgi:uncharacterized protein (TIGR02246 family)
MALRSALVAAALAAGCLASGCAPQVAPSEVAAAEVAALRADAEIRGLMHAYGRLIDARDWDGFAALWTDDATYVGGPGGELAGGPAIAAFLRDIIAANPSGIREPNFHVFFNEEITVTGQQARATSMSAFVAPDASGAASMVMLARYEDAFAQVNGRWKFTRRVVRGNLPASSASP